MSVFLLLTSAIAIGGKIAKAGEVVEVDQTEAKSLLHRGKAVLAEIDPAQLVDAVEVAEGEEVPEPSEQPAEAAEAAAQPAAEAPAKAKGGKKAK